LGGGILPRLEDPESQSISHKQQSKAHRELNKKNDALRIGDPGTIHPIPLVG
jgi:hypothetical protein